MLRRALLVVPLLGGLSAALGAALPARPQLAIVGAAVLGGVVATLLLHVAERRVAELAGQVTRFAAGETRLRFPEHGSGEWRRLSSGLNAIAASLEARIAQLSAERARVERLLDDLPPAILLFGADGLSYANRTARALFGVRRSGTRTPLQVLGNEAMAAAVGEAREAHTTVQLEVRRGERELVARAAPSDGEVALVVTDLTDLRRIEAIRRDFVTNASHELKTPVAGMQALAESLSVAVVRDPERARRMVALLEREASRLAQLVRELLDLARLEEAVGDAQRQPVDLHGLVRAEAQRLAPLAAERGVVLRDATSGSAPVVARPEDLRLVVANLLENAVRYNREGGRVVVRTSRAGGRVVLEVADTGIGIPSADLDRIFERFYRVDKARSRAVGGTGLGLAIVRHAVERSGGTVSVASVLGEGSTFTVALPVEGRDG